jgi:hypothetical protein
MFSRLLKKKNRIAALIFSTAGLLLANCQSTNPQNAIVLDSPSGSIFGVYEGNRFSVAISGSSATLSWADQTRGFVARLNTNPSPRPRCPCDIFDGPDGRRITVEKDFSGNYLSASYARRGAQADIVSIAGNHEGQRYTVTVGNTEASLMWNDGAQGFKASFNANPSPRPRCPCDVFDGPDGRRLILEKDLSTGAYSSVTYIRHGNTGGGTDIQSVSGTYRGFGFQISVTRQQATLTWNDGAQGFTASLNPNPNPRPRCPCDIFEGPGGRRILLETDVSTGVYTNAVYSRQ